MNPNYSFHAIALYMGLAFVPHAYAMTTLKKANNGKYNNVNPRGVEALTAYKKSIPGAVYARVERAKAAHCNMMESAPFFIGAVLAGNIAKLPVATMNLAVGAYIALRVIYALVYINVTNQAYSYGRSMLWFISTVLLGSIYVKAGNKLVAQG